MSHRLFALLALGLLAPALHALPAPGKGNSKGDAIACLVRPDSPPDDNAKGQLRIRSHTKKDQTDERLDLVVRRVDVLAPHRFFLEDGVDAGTFTDQGLLDAVSDELRFSLDTKLGDAVPDGADSMGDLTGRRIEVRSGADVVLHSVMPDYDASKKPLKAKLKLEAPAEGDPDSLILGRLHMRSKADKGQHRITIRVKQASFDNGDLHLWVEDDLGAFVDNGPFDQLGSSSKARFRRDCHKGEALPGDVLDLAGLAGRTLQVRDDSGVLLEVDLPDEPGLFFRVDTQVPSPACRTA